MMCKVKGQVDQGGHGKCGIMVCKLKGSDA